MAELTDEQMQQLTGLGACHLHFHPEATQQISIASATTLGGVKVGSGLSITGDGTLSATPYSLPIASASTLGGIKIGSQLSIAGDGTLSASAQSLSILTDTAISAPSLNQQLRYNALGKWENFTPAAGSGGWTYSSVVNLSGSLASTISGIPSSAQEVVIMIDGLSTSLNSLAYFQVGTSAGGIDGTNTYYGYNFDSGFSFSGVLTPNTVSMPSNAYALYPTTMLAACESFACIRMLLVDSATNTWLITGTGYYTGPTSPFILHGTKVMSGPLYSIRVLTFSVVTFDAGTFRVMYR